MKFLLLVAAFAVALCSRAEAQNPPQFDPALYEQFVRDNANLTSEGLLALYPSGKFYPAARTALGSTEYLDSILLRYPLSEYERSLLGRNGFIVLPSSQVAPTFGTRFEEVFHYDLPVYVSSDAILHSIHMSYNALCQEIEQRVMEPLLREMLVHLHTQTSAYRTRYAGNPALLQAVSDLDVYLSVPRRLLGESIEPVYLHNTALVDSALQLVDSETPCLFSLFGIDNQLCDFSQFTPRGRYTNSPEMEQYFRAMMWIGRMEFYLIPPQNTDLIITQESVQRQAIAAALLSQAMKESGAEKLYLAMDAILQRLVGNSDNITPRRLAAALATAGIADAQQLADTSALSQFQNTLRKDRLAFQAINSQILIAGGDSAVAPAASFMLMGQRFIIDSYITQSVVYDRIESRMLPSSLDILFALGNNPAAQFLQPELDKHKYAPQLAGLRYLIDSYDDSFWGSSMYNAWLNSIRALNTPDSATRQHFPPFMQTGAWWQFKMNSQLAAWAQLRHDNLLYAKQSYTTGVPTCSFPYSYVEPEPDLFRAVAVYADSSLRTFASIDTMLKAELPEWWPNGALGSVNFYFSNLSSTASQLGTIAEKELNHIDLSAQETEFLRGMLYKVPDDYFQGLLSGWYVDLFYIEPDGMHLESENMLRTDYTVADIHTAPTDAEGNLVGNIYHAGTGPVNLAIVIADCGGAYRAYVGPVFSYYERITKDFYRLTDEEWERGFTDSSNCANQLPIAHAYMASPDGKPLAPQPLLDMHTTGIDEPSVYIEPMMTPNPARDEFTLEFPVATPIAVEVSLYSQNGRRIALLDNSTAATNYRKTFSIKQFASGIYYVLIKAGGTGRAEMLVKQ